MNNQKIKVAILGATGYAGVELFRLLYQHPGVEISALSSVSFVDKNFSDVYKNFINIQNFPLVSQEVALQDTDVVFAALPHGICQEMAQQTTKNNQLFIDLGADFRLTDGEIYEKWYGEKYVHAELHKQAVYGLPELNREKIKSANIIGNPGCYPTSIALALYPLLSHGMIKIESIIADCKSGVTGAGRGLSQTTHFPDCNEGFSPYKVANHRHIPEIEQTLSQMASGTAKITFVPHLLPVNRGILSTIYTERKTAVSLEKIHECFKMFYEKEPFVRVMNLGDTCNINHVTHSNYCDISLHEDPHTNRIVVVSAIDNMIKGAAGQAIQNMNIRYGLEETTGLKLIPPAF